MGFGHTRSVKAAQKTGQKRGQNAAKDAGRRRCFDVVVASPRARPKAASGVFGLSSDFQGVNRGANRVSVWSLLVFSASHTIFGPLEPFLPRNQTESGFPRCPFSMVDSIGFFVQRRKNLRIKQKWLLQSEKWYGWRRKEGG